MAASAAMASHPYPDMPAPADEHLALVLDADLRLLAITERLRQHWSVHATALGLTPAQVKVLLHLWSGEATPMRKLARQLDHDASNLTTIVDRACRARSARRTGRSRRRHVRALVLTLEGERLRDRFWSSLAGDSGPLAPLRQGDVRSLTRLLAKLDLPAD
jgi:DNA-binding MarR family transcriptional regulator